MRHLFQGRKKGDQAEQMAERHLQQQGLKTLYRNYHCRAGEIDIIMQQGEVIVFVEVRYRRQARHGSAAESVTRSKQQKLLRAASHYLGRYTLHNRPCRFDVVAINGDNAEIAWIVDAFQQE